MNAPRKGWSPAAIETVRMHDAFRTVRSAGQVLSALINEPMPAALMRDYSEIAPRVVALADKAVAMVKARDAVVFGETIASQPKPANETSCPACAHCGAPATCFGSYEGAPEGFACDRCCGHGNEDGWCHSAATELRATRPTDPAPPDTARSRELDEQGRLK